MMIKKTSELIEELKQRYPGITIHYKLKTWYSQEQQVFFNCDTEPEKCLDKTLIDPHPPAYRVFYVIQSKTDDTYTLRETLYTNYPETSLEKWTPRYHSQLKPGGEAGLEAMGHKYIEYLGAEIRE